MKTVSCEPLTREAFAPFGDVIEIGPDLPNHPINAGTTQRFHELATPAATGKDARVIISMARAQPFPLPHTITLLERHPDGSQAFIPVVPARFLVIVAPDDNGRPGPVCAFLAGPGQGVNYAINVWHGTLTALDTVTDFVVVDREGAGDNLEEFHFDEPITIIEPKA